MLHRPVVKRREQKAYPDFIDAGFHPFRRKIDLDAHGG